MVKLCSAYRNICSASPSPFPPTGMQTRQTRPDANVAPPPPLLLLPPPPHPPLLCRSRSGLHRLPQGCDHDAFPDSLGSSLLRHAAAARPRQSGDVCDRAGKRSTQTLASPCCSRLCFPAVCGGGRTNHITGGSVSILPKEGLPQRGLHRYHLLHQLPDWTRHGYQGNGRMNGEDKRWKFEVPVNWSD